MNAFCSNCQQMFFTNTLQTQASTESELKDNKIPMPATTRTSSSLPVAKRRSSFKSSMSSTSSREGSPLKYSTPSKPGKKKLFGVSAQSYYQSLLFEGTWIIRSYRPPGPLSRILTNCSNTFLGCSI